MNDRKKYSCRSIHEEESMKEIKAIIDPAG